LFEEGTGMSIEAMKQVKQELEHIKQYGYATDIDHAIKTLGQAIVEAQKPEPVAWDDDAWGKAAQEMSGDFVKRVKANWESAPKRDWVGLTDEEIKDMYNKAINETATVSQFVMFKTFARAIEAKLKEKNT
jgi:hypothetical protein